MYEGRDKHRQALLRRLVWKEELSQDEGEEILGAEEAKQLRSLAATLNYMSFNRSPVQYAAMEVCRNMAYPTRGCFLYACSDARCTCLQCLGDHLDSGRDMRASHGPRKQVLSARLS